VAENLKKAVCDSGIEVVQVYCVWLGCS